MYKKIGLLIILTHSLVAVSAPIGKVPKHNHKASHKSLKRISAVSDLPKLRSSIALIYDELNHHLIYAKKADAVSPIASISKLMTAMVVLDAKLPMDQEITISPEDEDTLKGSHSRMLPGMTLTRRELITLALMSSENRAAAALARTYPGGTRAAVKKMNEKALELEMNDTHFMDPTGLNSANVSTAKDLVKMVQAAQTYEPIHEATTSVTLLAKPEGYRPLLYRNTNPLVHNPSWIIGISKTGFINEAGRCLVMQTKFKQRPLVIVLLNSQGKSTRIGDANRIKRWMEASYRQSTRYGQQLPI